MASLTKAESYSELSPLADQLPVGICLIDREFHIVRWNSALEQWTGQLRTEVLGHNLLDLFPSLQHAELRVQIEQVFATGEARCLEGEAYRHFIPARWQSPPGDDLQLSKDDPSAPSAGNRHGDDKLMVQRTTVSLCEAELSLVLLTIEDITLLDRQRRRHQEQQEQLEALSQQLATIRQQQAEFVANMSQELRVPLTSIFGYAEFLREHETVPEHRAALEGMRRNGEKLATVINDVLDYTKIEARQLRINIERFELAPLLNDLVSLIRLATVEQGITFECDFDSQLPASLESDPIRLRQILLNLLTNAVTFTESGSVTLAVRYHANRTGGEVEFEVRDTGSGISPENMQQLFLPFRRNGYEISPRKRGTGLGLAICHRLAFLLGGRLAATSRVHEGSTFTFTLPMTPVSASIPSPCQPRNLAQSAAEIKQAIAAASDESISGRILLVEDNLDNQRIIAYFLQCAGAKVDVASDGIEALEKIAQLEAEGEVYDFVLMDMQMPRMDGFEATQALRNQGYEKPIVAITAHGADYDATRCREAGCTDYAAKPLQRKSLIQLVSRHLKASVNDILPFNRLVQR